MQKRLVDIDTYGILSVYGEAYSVQNIDSGGPSIGSGIYKCNVNCSHKLINMAQHLGGHCSLTDNDVFENVGVVVRCSGHCGSEREKRWGSLGQ